MKIIAIFQRGRKRDCFDLYWLLQHRRSLEDIMRRLKSQYPSVAHDYHHILKSLLYFEDAESDPPPELNFKADWREVKAFLREAVPTTMKMLVDLK